MRQKHDLWGGNPYNRATEKRKNLNYFLKQHQSLIYITKDEIKAITNFN